MQELELVEVEDLGNLHDHAACSSERVLTQASLEIELAVTMRSYGW